MQKSFTKSILTFIVSILFKQIILLKSGLHWTEIQQQWWKSDQTTVRNKRLEYARYWPTWNCGGCTTSHKKINAREKRQTNIHQFWYWFPRWFRNRRSYWNTRYVHIHRLANYTQCHEQNPREFFKILVPGGISLSQAMTLIDQLQARSNIIGMELTEVNPALGDVRGHRHLAFATRSIITCVFGACTKGLN